MGGPVDLAVVGAGYVGLVAAACLADLGHRVVCMDVDAERIARLTRGETPISEPGLDRLVDRGLARGLLSFSADPASLRGALLVMVAVGTLDANGEWTGEMVRSAVNGIAADPSGPRSIVIRSTLLPGTASSLADELARVHPSVCLALNPEFTREGSAISDFLRPDRVIIGADEPTSVVVRDLRLIYEALEAPIMVTDMTSAEMIKVGSNVFLAAKITLANELARLCESAGANVADVVDGIGLDGRIGRASLSPGPGYGGSCLPAQSRALPAVAARSGISTPVIDAIDRSNELQASWLLDLAETTLGRGLDRLRVAVLGLTFKAGTGDLRKSPALRLVAALAERGAIVTVHDPVSAAEGVAELAQRGITVRSADSPTEACRDADATFIATEWADYVDLDWHRVREVMAGDCVVDGRAVLTVERAASAGLQVVGLPRVAANRPVGARAREGAGAGVS